MRFYRKATLQSQFANRGTFIFITEMLNKFNFTNIYFYKTKAKQLKGNMLVVA